MREDKYLKIVRWAETRYRKNARLILWEKGKASKFKNIETLAFDKYITRG